MYYFKKLNGYVYGKDVNSPEEDTDVLLTQEEVDERNRQSIAKEMEKMEQDNYVKKIKSILIQNFDDITKEEMIEFTAAFNEYKELGQVKLDRYPLVTAQIQEWTEQGLL